jgi:hypothetical protein
MASLGYSPSDSYPPFHFSALPVHSLNEGGPVSPELAVSRITLMPCRATSHGLSMRLLSGWRNQGDVPR